MYTCHELSQVNNIQNFMRRHRVYTDTSSHIDVHSYMWTIRRPTCMDTHMKTYIHVSSRLHVVNTQKSIHGHKSTYRHIYIAMYTHVWLTYTFRHIPSHAQSSLIDTYRHRHTCMAMYTQCRQSLHVNTSIHTHMWLRRRTSYMNMSHSDTHSHVDNT